MRYKQGREQTAELLRLVLRRWPGTRAGFHPMNYAVWYEYLAGINPRLIAAVDARLAQCNCLTDADVVALYEQYLDAHDVAASAQVRADIARLGSRSMALPATPPGKCVTLGRSWTGYRQQLQRQIGPSSSIGGAIADSRHLAGARYHRGFQ